MHTTVSVLPLRCKNVISLVISISIACCLYSSCTLSSCLSNLPLLYILYTILIYCNVAIQSILRMHNTVLAASAHVPKKSGNSSVALMCNAVTLDKRRNSCFCLQLDGLTLFWLDGTSSILSSGAGEHGTVANPPNFKQSAFLRYLVIIWAVDVLGFNFPRVCLLRVQQV